LRATTDNSAAGSGGDDSRNIKPLKRAKDDFLLANAEISPDTVVIVPVSGINLNVNTPPFKSFFLNRILEGMKSKDAEKVSQGALGESDALNYRVEEDDDGSGGIKRIVINKYREKDRLQEIFNTSAWVFTRMLEKSGK
jgi:maltodextrin utilization protein YvdJ